MARFDTEFAAAAVSPARIPTAAEAWAFVESLPELWSRTSEAGRQIAEVAFEQIDVPGGEGIHVHADRSRKSRGAGTRPSGPASSA
jgi:hypothetical protein